MPPFDDWSSERLIRTLEERTSENLHLDYKDKQSLLKNKKGDDISKDVSAFLNSDGGVLIYGVPEENDAAGTPIPKNNDKQIIGFKKHEVSKEQIEDLITGNISPKPRADLFRISEINYEHRAVFIVQVLVGIGEVWQASDKRYYRRANYKVEPMQHYEIELVRNRNVGPNIKLNLGFDRNWNQIIYYDRWDNTKHVVHIGLQNHSVAVVESVLIELWAQKENYSYDSMSHFKRAGANRIRHQHQEISSPTTELQYFQLHWNPSNFGLRDVYAPIFKLTDPLHVTQFPINGPSVLFGRLQAPRMEPKGYVVKIGGPDIGNLTMEMFESTVEIA